MMLPNSLHGKIPSLDGIRAVAVLIVVLSHYGLGFIVPGGFGVTIFFFLSGFLITSLLIDEYDETGGISIGSFFIRRALRIFPPMYLALLMSGLMLIYGVYEKEITFAAVIAQIFHVTNYYTIYNSSQYTLPGTGVLWSLAIEEHFYLIFPFVMSYALVKISRLKLAAIMLGGCFLVLAWRCVLLYFFDVHSDRIYKGTDTRIDSILWGAVLALSYGWVSERVTQGFAGIDLSFAFISLGSVGCIAVLLLRNYEFMHTLRYTLQGAALFAVFWGAVSFSNSYFFSWLNSFPMKWLGKFSYSIYLFHFLALYWLDYFLGGRSFFVYLLAFLLVLLMSYFNYICIERPLYKVRKKNRVQTSM